MPTPLNRLTRIIAVCVAVLGVALVVAAGAAGSTAFAQVTQPASPPSSTGSQPGSITAPTADPVALQPPAASADTAPAPPEASPAPAAPPATSAETTDAPPSESTLAQALAAYDKQDFAAAVEALNNAIGSDPSSVEAHYYLGYALYKLKRFDESRVAFAQAYQLRSNYLPPVAKSK
jgi:Flp pilus assembly protein TadD